MQIRLKTAVGPVELSLRGQDARRELVLDAATHELICGRQTDGLIEFTLDGRRRRAWLAADGDARHVFLDGAVHTVHLHGEEADEDEGPDPAAGPELRTQLPGKVVRLLVVEGQTVTSGQPLVILEAMKMETEIVAARDGTVARIRCEEGQILGPGDPLLDLRHDAD